MASFLPSELFTFLPAVREQLHSLEIGTAGVANGQVVAQIRSMLSLLEEHERILSAPSFLDAIQHTQESQDYDSAYVVHMPVCQHVLETALERCQTVSSISSSFAISEDLQRCCTVSARLFEHEFGRYRPPMAVKAVLGPALSPCGLHSYSAHFTQHSFRNLLLCAKVTMDVHIEEYLHAFDRHGVCNVYLLLHRIAEKCSHSALQSATESTKELLKSFGIERNVHLLSLSSLLRDGSADIEALLTEKGVLNPVDLSADWTQTLHSLDLHPAADIAQQLSNTVGELPEFLSLMKEHGAEALWATVREEIIQSVSLFKEQPFLFTLLVKKVTILPDNTNHQGIEDVGAVISRLLREKEELERQLNSLQQQLTDCTVQLAQSQQALQLAQQQPSPQQSSATS